jgi:hypothetical protein
MLSSITGGHNMTLNEKVQSLVDAKKFDEAITLLARVNHPRAIERMKQIEIQRAAYKRIAQRNASISMVIAFFACAASLAICSLLNM